MSFCTDCGSALTAVSRYCGGCATSVAGETDGGPGPADNKSYSEKRRYARHPGPFNAYSPGRELYEMRVMNLGLGGCFVLVHSGHAVDETFQMQIDLGDQGLLDVSATTLYHTINGSALTFINLSQKAFDQIQRTVDASWVKPNPSAKDWRFPMACPACKAMSGKPHRAHTNTDELVIELRCSNCRHGWELSAPPPAVFLIRKEDRRSASVS